MAIPHTDRSAINPVKRLSGKHPELEKCPRKPRILGVTDIRNSFGKEALLIKKGDFVYDVSGFPELYQKGV